MHEITIHKAHETDRQPQVYSVGEPGVGGAGQCYEIIYAENGQPSTVLQLDFISLDRAGVTNEALLAVVIDRFEGFQSGEFPCLENERALTHCRHALAAMRERTLARIARGVENQATA